jgi:2'-5' RNA ligase
MKYINKGKRDILIFPQFTNIEKIENIRKQYDELYKILPPHITLAFPFESSMSNEELKDRLMQALKSVKPFEIVMSGVSLYKDENIKTNYIFLNVVSGVKEIQMLHNEIYEKVLNQKMSFEYIPHITLGITENEQIEFELNDKFKTIVTKVFVEEIGENEESNVLFEVDL